MRPRLLHALLLSIASTVAAAQSITIIGSKTMYAMNVALAKRYEVAHPGVRLQMSGDGTAKGFDAVVHGKADAAAMTRALRPEERKEYHAAMKTEGDLVPIALEGLSIYLHPTNPVSDLKPEQVFAIFSGTITNWKQVGGPDAPIHVYSFDNTTGRYWYLFEELMNRKPFAASVRYTDEHPELPPPQGLARKEQQMLEWVSHDAHAIGFGDLKKVRVVKIAKINGYWPAPDDIRAHRYPFARHLGFLTGAHPPAQLVDFIDWSRKQADIIRDAGFVPIE